MPKAPKPVALISKNLTKEEKESRLAQEEKLKGNKDKVYKVPKGTIKPVALIYKNIVNELRAADILNNLDIELILTTSNAIYMMKNARNELYEMGAIIKTYKIIEREDGTVDKILTGIGKNPAVQVEKDYQAIFHQGCLQLGLSPSSRAKLALINVEANREETDEDKLF